MRIRCSNGCGIQWPTAVYLSQPTCLEGLVREIQSTMRPEVIGDWLHRPLPVYDGATSHEMILSGRCNSLRGLLQTRNFGIFS